MENKTYNNFLIKGLWCKLVQPFNKRFLNMFVFYYIVGLVLQALADLKMVYCYFPFFPFFSRMGYLSINGP